MNNTKCRLKTSCIVDYIDIYICYQLNCVVMCCDSIEFHQFGADLKFLDFMNRFRENHFLAILCIGQSKFNRKKQH